MLKIISCEFDLNSNNCNILINTDIEELKFTIIDTGNTFTVKPIINGDYVVSVSLDNISKRIKIEDIKKNLILIELFIYAVNTKNESYDVNHIDYTYSNELPPIQGFEPVYITDENPFIQDGYDRGLNDGLVLGQMI